MTSLSNKNVAPFEPFKEYLDQDKAIQILNGLTKGADDGEIYFERNITEALIFDNNNLKTASFNAAEGFGIRTVLEELDAEVEYLNASANLIKSEAEKVYNLLSIKAILGELTIKVIDSEYIDNFNLKDKDLNFNILDMKMFN